MSACVLTEDARTRLGATDKDAIGIVVKIFPKTNLFPPDPVTRSVTYSMVSQCGWGPKLLYTDNDCAVNEYIINVRIIYFHYISNQ